jgi:hypothetical protein
MACMPGYRLWIVRQNAANSAVFQHKHWETGGWLATSPGFCRFPEIWKNYSAGARSGGGSWLTPVRAMYSPSWPATGRVPRVSAATTPAGTTSEHRWGHSRSTFAPQDAKSGWATAWWMTEQDKRLSAGTSTETRLIVFFALLPVAEYRLARTGDEPCQGSMSRHRDRRQPHEWLWQPPSCSGGRCGTVRASTGC